MDWAASRLRSQPKSFTPFGASLADRHDETHFAMEVRERWQCDHVGHICRCFEGLEEDERKRIRFASVATPFSQGIQDPKATEHNERTGGELNAVSVPSRRRPCVSRGVCVENGIGLG